MRNANFFTGIVKPLIVGLVVLNLAIVAIGTFELNKSKQQFEKQAAINTRNLSQVLEQSISGIVDKLDIVLLVTTEEIEQQIASGGVDTRKLTGFLKLQKQRVPDIYNLRVTDAKGYLRYGSDFSDLPVVNYADRDYFLRHSANPDAGLFISKPLFGKTTKQWLLTFSRRINKPDGSFGGLLYGTINLEHFSKLFAVVEVGPRGSITLRDDELGIITSSEGLQLNGEIVGNKKLSEPFTAALKSNPNEGTYISGITSIDHISRMHSYYKFANYPFYINCGIAEEVYLADWHKQVWETGALIFAFMLSSAIFSYLLIGLLRQQHSFEVELERQAHIDYLTGVSNRGHFMQQAELELARAIRYGNSLSLFMIDVDYFKQVNDLHGHKVGDHVLQKLTEVCRGALREVDIIGRVGGEEFAILLPETNKVVASEVAERLRVAIEAARFPIENGLPIQFTVSIGVSSLVAKDDNLDKLLNEADKALYQAKEAGRNRICNA